MGKQIDILKKGHYLSQSADTVLPCIYCLPNGLNCITEGKEKNHCRLEGTFSLVQLPYVNPGPEC